MMVLSSLVRSGGVVFMFISEICNESVQVYIIKMAMYG